MHSLLHKLVLSITFLMIISTETSTADDRKKELLICSAYHLKEKLNNQYSSEEIYLYHDTYFNNLQKVFLESFPETSTSGFILSITSIMESWSYTAQEKGLNYSNNEIKSKYKKLCNSILK